MRVVTWNMGCAFGNYRACQGESWAQLEDLDPDIALLQEALLPDSLEPQRLIANARNPGGAFHTVIYSRRGYIRQLDLDADLAPMLGGQVVLAEVSGVSGMAIVVASIHTRTGSPAEPALTAFNALTTDDRRRLRLPSDPGSWNAAIIAAAVDRHSRGRRFIAGGDFNLAWRFDETRKFGSAGWAHEQFRIMRDMGWRRPHLKFHAGEQRTLFRKPHELFQLDHFFTDEETCNSATRCDVVLLQDLERLSDHAPLVLEIEE